MKSLARLILDLLARSGELHCIYSIDELTGEGRDSADRDRRSTIAEPPDQHRRLPTDDGKHKS